MKKEFVIADEISGSRGKTFELKDSWNRKKYQIEVKSRLMGGVEAVLRSRLGIEKIASAREVSVFGLKRRFELYWGKDLLATVTCRFSPLLSAEIDNGWKIKGSIMHYQLFDGNKKVVASISKTIDRSGKFQREQYPMEYKKEEDKLSLAVLLMIMAYFYNPADR